MEIMTDEALVLIVSSSSGGLGDYARRIVLAVDGGSTIEGASTVHRGPFVAPRYLT